MAEIRRLPPLRHLRSDPSVHLLAYRAGRLVRSGRGLTFWFLPMGASVAEVPVDDRDLSFALHGRTLDFQPVTLQGVISYRVTDPERLAQRVDFSVDLRTGAYARQPLDQLAGLLIGLAQQLAARQLGAAPVEAVLRQGPDAFQEGVGLGLREDPLLQGMGLEVVSVRVLDLKPSAELEKALQTPVREALQQRADEATFARRALAVEKERAIAENELQSQIELATREQELIRQQGQNAQRRARDEAEARRIEAEAEGERTRLQAAAAADQVRLAAAAEAERIGLVETARAEGEGRHLGNYRELSPAVLLSLAAHELAGKLQGIEHLNITPELFGPALSELLQAGVRRLRQEPGA
jgi:regulator of protease activity HflC (stomatin/prohibitin superfamily)